jgi:D-threo-aldose 1-dehydrogenase
VHYNYAPAPDWVMNKAARLQDVCAAHGVRLVDAAFQFPLRHPAVVSMIPGGQGLAEMASNLQAATAKVPDALWQDLKAEGLIRADAPV